MKKKIAILGSTGSIGTQALDVIAQHPDRFEVEVLTANNNYKMLEKQARLFYSPAGGKHQQLDNGNDRNCQPEHHPQRRFTDAPHVPIPAGRAGYQLGHLTRKQPARALRLQNCRPELLYAHHSHLDLYGNYISSFCGGLALGDWHDLPRLLADVRTTSPI